MQCKYGCAGLADALPISCAPPPPREPTAQQTVPVCTRLINESATNPDLRHAHA